MVDDEPSPLEIYDTAGQVGKQWVWVWEWVWPLMWVSNWEKTSIGT